MGEKKPEYRKWKHCLVNYIVKIDRIVPFYLSFFSTTLFFFLNFTYGAIMLHYIGKILICTHDMTQLSRKRERHTHLATKISSSNKLEYYVLANSLLKYDDFLFSLSNCHSSIELQKQIREEQIYYVII